MVITLLTDFGLQDPYAGIMKGVILSIVPGARIVDITHGIPAQNVQAAAIVLAESFRYFPEGTVHCAVVDPGVGTERAVMIAEVGGHLFTAPDNGILAAVLETHPDHRIYQVTRPDYFLHKVSHTFHGRDIFAPVAAHLAQGVRPASMGRSMDDYVRGNSCRPIVEDSGITGEIIYIDRFGNLITNIMGSLLAGRKKLIIETAGRVIPGPMQSYTEVQSGLLLAIIGSLNRLEIAVRDGSAAEQPGLKPGVKVHVRFTGPAE